MLQAIYLVNRSHHGSVVKCEATNDVGTAQKETTLDVHCKYTKIVCEMKMIHFWGHLLLPFNCHVI